ncbi:amidohydrolase family protein [Paralimibaculum aggregatum]|uniref:Amidohydrolase family protein n=1 Tax=Paralimibaculum aggregatum TaxID=3036245 RepID=A0ABQ6LQG2_9RHOB|nr:amidohydrolase family protein [Limibaculum sp. NKW23]GMG83129.1 amidohydrolase family protein [Limibaculum sp. NKW23]
MLLTGANRLMGGVSGPIDGHAHVFHHALPMAPGRRYTPTADATLADYAALLRGHGLAGGLLVQPSFLGADNSFLLAALREAEAWEDLALRGVVVLDPADPGWPQALAEADAAGVVGMRLNLVGRPADAAALAPWEPLLAAVSARGWHVELHCEGARLAPVLEALLTRCETVVVDHFGLPSDAAGAACPGHRAILAAPRGRVFVKVSAPYRVFPRLASAEAARACRTVFGRLAGALGPEQLLWGSDWPWTQFEGRHDYAASLGWQACWTGASGA